MEPQIQDLYKMMIEIKTGQATLLEGINNQKQFWTPRIEKKIDEHDEGFKSVTELVDELRQKIERQNTIFWTVGMVAGGLWVVLTVWVTGLGGAVGTWIHNK